MLVSKEWVLSTKRFTDRFCLVCSNVNTTRWDEPPYKINASGIHRPLGNKKMDASAVHYDDILEYNAP